MATKRLTKTILLLVVAFLFAIAPIFSANAHKVSADISTSSYFNNATTVIDEDLLKVTIGNEEQSTFKRSLVTSAFEVVFNASSNISTLDFTLQYDAYYVNGDIAEDDEISVAFVMDIENSKLYWSNDDTNFVSFTFDVSKPITLRLTETDNIYTALVTNNSNSNSLAQGDVNYRTKVVDKAVATFGFEPTTSDSEDAIISISSIDQDYNVSAGTYKQSFKMNEEKTKIESFATPYITISKEFAVKDGDTFVRFMNTRYNLRYTCHNISPDSSVSTSCIKVQETTGVDIFQASTTSYIIISDSFGTPITDGRSGQITLIDDDKEVGENELRVLDVIAYDADKVDVDSDNDSETGNDAAPTYNYDQIAIDNFKAKLEESLKQEYDVGDKKEEHYIRIGSGEYLTLPSMEDMVSDEFCNYDSLTYTVKYYTPSNSSGTSSSLRIPITEAGTYRFYVMFKDDNGNEMWENDFLKYDGDTIIGVADRYKSYVFEFTLLDDAPTTVTAGTQEKAYVGLEYTATSFTIDASDYNVEYNLYYSADNQTWSKAITKTSDLVEPNKDDYTSGCSTSKEYTELKDWYDYCKEINYNGTLTFTPDKVGYYKIECKVSTKITTVTESVTINVTGEPQVVTPDTHWVQNNIWSIIFLSVGSLALIGIILLLVIKPKDKDDVGISKKKN